MSELDLVVRNGEIATTSGSMGRADVGIVDGVIARIGGSMEGRQEIDAAGKLLLPGGIDAHVHLSLPPGQAQGDGPTWVDDFTSGSAAAFAGGITTLGNMTFPRVGETPLAALARDAALARQQTMADLFLHPVLSDVNEPVLDDIPHLLESGCNSIKIFTVFPAFDAKITAYVEAIRRAGNGGLISLIHCEDYALVEEATNRLLAAGHVSINHYAASRPIVAEVLATQRAVAIAEATGAPVYVVHLSSARALQVCVEAQARGLPVYVETRPTYLHLTEERFRDEDGAKYVGQPPLRRQEDVDALWDGLAQGVIHTVCTDHAPWSLADKLDPAHDIGNLRPGVANLQPMLPMLYSEGVHAGRLTLGRFVQVAATNAARLFGLYPRKGHIAVGSDADLVVFDPHLTRTIEPSMLKSNADYSSYEGWEVTGWPVVTVRRGEIVFQDDEITARPGSGELVSRRATAML